MAGAGLKKKKKKKSSLKFTASLNLKGKVYVFTFYRFGLAFKNSKAALTGTLLKLKKQQQSPFRS